MILNQQQIEEIENSGGFGMLSDIPNLLETVKALRKENEAQRKLLRRAVFYTNWIDSQAAQSLAEQIEEHLK